MVLHQGKYQNTSCALYHHDIPSRTHLRAADVGRVVWRRIEGGKPADAAH